MWNKITGKSDSSSDGRRKEPATRRRAESIVSSSTSRNPPRSVEDRSDYPPTLSSRGTSYLPPPSTVSVASFTTAPDRARTMDNDDRSERTASYYDDFDDESRSSRSSRTERSDKHRARSSSRDRKHHRRNSKRDERREDRKDRDRHERQKRSSMSSTKARSSKYEDDLVESPERTRASDIPLEASRSFGGQVSSPGLSQYPTQYVAATSAPSPAHGYPSMDAHVSSQFPGQNPSQYSVAYRPPLSVDEGGHGLATDYYGDQGQSVHFQPGVRPQPPSLIVGAEPHLMAASPIPAPPEETGHGSAAEFFAGGDMTTSAPAGSEGRPPVKPPRPQSIPGSFEPEAPVKPPRPSATKPPKQDKPNMFPTAAAAAAGAAVGYGLGHESDSSHHAENAHYSNSASFYQQGTNHNVEGSAFYASPSTISSSSHGQSVFPAVPSFVDHGSPATSMPPSTPAGAAGLAAGAYGLHEHHHHHHANHHTLYAETPQEGPFYHTPNTSTYGENMQVMALEHKHRSPVTKFVDWWKDHDDVRKMEEYTEYIGVCRYCFDAHDPPENAPRIHHYPRRRVSNGSTHRHRVDKESRYSRSSSDDEAKSKRGSKSFIGSGLAGYSLAKMGKALWSPNQDFDDAYSAKSGRQYRNSRTSFTERSRSRSRDRRSQTSRGVIRNRSRDSRVSTGSRHSIDHTSSGKDYKIVHRYSESHSPSQNRKSGIIDAAIAAALGEAAAEHAHSEHRSPSNSPRRQSVRTSRHSGNYEYGKGSVPGLGGEIERHRTSIVPISSPEEPKAHQSSQSGTPGVFSGMFSSSNTPKPKAQKQKQKKKGFFNFANSSSSSADSALAYDAGTDRRRRSSEYSRKRRSSDDNINTTLAGITATMGALMAAQSKHKGSKSPKKRKSPRANKRNSKVSEKERIPGAFESSGLDDDDGAWVSESEADDDDSSSVDSALAFGSNASHSSKRRKSMDSLKSDASGTNKWRWRWRPNEDKEKEKRKTRDSAKETGLGVAGAAAAMADNTSSVSSDPTLHSVYPVATDDPTSFEAARRSATLEHNAPLLTSRPETIPLQQPQPIVLVSNAVYTTQAAYAPPAGYTAPSGPPVFSNGPAAPPSGRVEELNTSSDEERPAVPPKDTPPESKGLGARISEAAVAAGAVAVGAFAAGKRDSTASAKRDSTAAKRESIASAKRDSTAPSKRDSTATARRDSTSDKRDNISTKRESGSNKRESITTKRESISNKRDSSATPKGPPSNVRFSLTDDQLEKEDLERRKSLAKKREEDYLREKADMERRKELARQREEEWQMIEKERQRERERLRYIEEQKHLEEKRQLAEVDRLAAEKRKAEEAEAQIRAKLEAEHKASLDRETARIQEEREEAARQAAEREIIAREEADRLAREHEAAVRERERLEREIYEDDLRKQHEAEEAALREAEDAARREQEREKELEDELNYDIESRARELRAREKDIVDPDRHSWDNPVIASNPVLANLVLHDEEINRAREDALASLSGPTEPYYTAVEPSYAKPGRVEFDDDHIYDEDAFDPDYFKKDKSKRDSDRESEIARKAAGKVLEQYRDSPDVIADLEHRYSNSPQQNMAEFWAPPELRDRSPEAARDANGGVHIYNVANVVAVQPPYDPAYNFTTTASRDGLHAPQEHHSPIPTLNLIEPTPPASQAGSIRGSHSAPSSPAVQPLDKVPEVQEISDVAVGEPEEKDKDKDEAPTEKSSPERKRSSVTWGADETFHYEDTTPESSREQYMRDEDMRKHIPEEWKQEGDRRYYEERDHRDQHEDHYEPHADDEIVVEHSSPRSDGDSTMIYRPSSVETAYSPSLDSPIAEEIHRFDDGREVFESHSPEKTPTVITPDEQQPQDDFYPSPLFKAMENMSFGAPGDAAAGAEKDGRHSIIEDEDLDPLEPVRSAESLRSQEEKQHIPGSFVEDEHEHMSEPRYMDKQPTVESVPESPVVGAHLGHEAEPVVLPLHKEEPEPERDVAAADKQNKKKKRWPSLERDIRDIEPTYRPYRASAPPTTDTNAAEERERHGRTRDVKSELFDPTSRDVEPETGRRASLDDVVAPLGLAAAAGAVAEALKDPRKEEPLPESLSIQKPESPTQANGEREPSPKGHGEGEGHQRQRSIPSTAFDDLDELADVKTPNRKSKRRSRFGSVSPSPLRSELARDDYNGRQAAAEPLPKEETSPLMTPEAARALESDPLEPRLKSYVYDEPEEMAPEAGVPLTETKVAEPQRAAEDRRSSSLDQEPTYAFEKYNAERKKHRRHSRRESSPRSDTARSAASEPLDSRDEDTGTRRRHRRRATADTEDNRSVVSEGQYDDAGHRKHKHRKHRSVGGEGESNDTASSVATTEFRDDEDDERRKRKQKRSSRRSSEQGVAHESPDRDREVKSEVGSDGRDKQRRRSSKRDGDVEDVASVSVASSATKGSEEVRKDKDKEEKKDGKEKEGKEKKSGGLLASLFGGGHKSKDSASSKDSKSEAGKDAKDATEPSNKERRRSSTTFVSRLPLPRAATFGSSSSSHSNAYYGSDNDDDDAAADGARNQGRKKHSRDDSGMDYDYYNSRRRDDDKASVTAAPPPTPPPVSVNSAAPATAAFPGTSDGGSPRSSWSRRESFQNQQLRSPPTKTVPLAALLPAELDTDSAAVVTPLPPSPPDSPTDDAIATPALRSPVRTAASAPVARSVSATAIPLRFRMRPVSSFVSGSDMSPSLPGSGTESPATGTSRRASFAGPMMTLGAGPSASAPLSPIPSLSPGGLSPRRLRGHNRSPSTEFKRGSTAEFRPLYLVERNAAAVRDELRPETLPSLPSSRSASEGGVSSREEKQPNEAETEADDSDAWLSAVEELPSAGATVPDGFLNIPRGDVDDVSEGESGWASAVGENEDYGKQEDDPAELWGADSPRKIGGQERARASPDKELQLPPSLRIDVPQNAFVRSVPAAPTATAEQSGRADLGSPFQSPEYLDSEHTTPRAAMFPFAPGLERSRTAVVHDSASIDEALVAAALAGGAATAVAQGRSPVTDPETEPKPEADVQVEATEPAEIEGSSIAVPETETETGSTPEAPESASSRGKPDAETEVDIEHVATVPETQVEMSPSGDVTEPEEERPVVPEPPVETLGEEPATTLKPDLDAVAAVPETQAEVESSRDVEPKKEEATVLEPVELQKEEPLVTSTPETESFVVIPTAQVETTPSRDIVQPVKEETAVLEPVKSQEENVIFPTSEPEASAAVPKTQAETALIHDIAELEKEAALLDTVKPQEGLVTEPELPQKHEPEVHAPVELERSTALEPAAPLDNMHDSAKDAEADAKTGVEPEVKTEAELELELSVAAPEAQTETSSRHEIAELEKEDKAAVVDPTKPQKEPVIAPEHDLEQETEIPAPIELERSSSPASEPAVPFDNADESARDVVAGAVAPTPETELKPLAREEAMAFGPAESPEEQISVPELKHEPVIETLPEHERIIEPEQEHVSELEPKRELVDPVPKQELESEAPTLAELERSPSPEATVPLAAAPLGDDDLDDAVEKENQEGIVPAHLTAPLHSPEAALKDQPVEAAHDAVPDVDDIAKDVPLPAIDEKELIAEPAPMPLALNQGEDVRDTEFHDPIKASTSVPDDNNIFAAADIAAATESEVVDDAKTSGSSSAPTSPLLSRSSSTSSSKKKKNKKKSKNKGKKAEVELSFESEIKPAADSEETPDVVRERTILEEPVDIEEAPVTVASEEPILAAVEEPKEPGAEVSRSQQKDVPTEATPAVEEVKQEPVEEENLPVERPVEVQEPTINVPAEEGTKAIMHEEAEPEPMVAESASEPASKPVVEPISEFISEPVSEPLSSPTLGRKGSKKKRRKSKKNGSASTPLETPVETPTEEKALELQPQPEVVSDEIPPQPEVESEQVPATQADVVSEPIPEEQQHVERETEPAVSTREPSDAPALAEEHPASPLVAEEPQSVLEPVPETIAAEPNQEPFAQQASEAEPVDLSSEDVYDASEAQQFPVFEDDLTIGEAPLEREVEPLSVPLTTSTAQENEPAVQELSDPEPVAPIEDVAEVIASIEEEQAQPTSVPQQVNEAEPLSSLSPAATMPGDKQAAHKHPDPEPESVAPAEEEPPQPSSGLQEPTGEILLPLTFHESTEKKVKEEDFFIPEELSTLEDLAEPYEADMALSDEELVMQGLEEAPVPVAETPALAEEAAGPQHFEAWPESPVEETREDVPVEHVMSSPEAEPQPATEIESPILPLESTFMPFDKKSSSSVSTPLDESAPELPVSEDEQEKEIPVVHDTSPEPVIESAQPAAPGEMPEPLAAVAEQLAPVHHDTEENAKGTLPQSKESERPAHDSAVVTEPIIEPESDVEPDTRAVDENTLKRPVAETTFEPQEQRQLFEPETEAVGAPEELFHDAPQPELEELPQVAEPLLELASEAMYEDLPEAEKEIEPGSVISNKKQRRKDKKKKKQQRQDNPWADIPVETSTTTPAEESSLKQPTVEEVEDAAALPLPNEQEDADLEELGDVETQTLSREMPVAVKEQPSRAEDLTRDPEVVSEIPQPFDEDKDFGEPQQAPVVFEEQPANEWDTKNTEKAAEGFTPFDEDKDHLEPQQSPVILQEHPTREQDLVQDTAADDDVLPPLDGDKDHMKPEKSFLAEAEPLQHTRESSALEPMDKDVEPAGVPLPDEDEVEADLREFVEAEPESFLQSSVEGATVPQLSVAEEPEAKEVTPEPSPLEEQHFTASPLSPVNVNMAVAEAEPPVVEPLNKESARFVSPPIEAMTEDKLDTVPPIQETDRDLPFDEPLVTDPETHLAQAAEINDAAGEVMPDAIPLPETSDKDLSEVDDGVGVEQRMPQEPLPEQLSEAPTMPIQEALTGLEAPSSPSTQYMDTAPITSTPEEKRTPKPKRKKSKKGKKAKSSQSSVDVSTPSTPVIEKEQPTPAITEPEPQPDPAESEAQVENAAEPAPLLPAPLPSAELVEMALSSSELPEATMASAADNLSESAELLGPYASEIPATDADVPVEEVASPSIHEIAEPEPALERDIELEPEHEPFLAESAKEPSEHGNEGTQSVAAGLLAAFGFGGKKKKDKQNKEPAVAEPETAERSAEIQKDEPLVATQKQDRVAETAPLITDPTTATEKTLERSAVPAPVEHEQSDDVPVEEPRELLLTAEPEAAKPANDELVRSAEEATTVPLPSDADQGLEVPTEQFLEEAESPSLDAATEPEAIRSTEEPTEKLANGNLLRSFEEATAIPLPSDADLDLEVPVEQLSEVEPPEPQSGTSKPVADDLSPAPFEVDEVVQQVPAGEQVENEISLSDSPNVESGPQRTVTPESALDFEPATATPHVTEAGQAAEELPAIKSQEPASDISTPVIQAPFDPTVSLTGDLPANPIDAVSRGDRPSPATEWELPAQEGDSATEGKRGSMTEAPAELPRPASPVTESAFEPSWTTPEGAIPDQLTFAMFPERALEDVDRESLPEIHQPTYDQADFGVDEDSAMPLKEDTQQKVEPLHPEQTPLPETPAAEMSPEIPLGELLLPHVYVPDELPGSESPVIDAPEEVLQPFRATPEAQEADEIPNPLEAPLPETPLEEPSRSSDRSPQSPEPESQFGAAGFEHDQPIAADKPYAEIVEAQHPLPDVVDEKPLDKEAVEETVPDDEWSLPSPSNSRKDKRKKKAKKGKKAVEPETSVAQSEALEPEVQKPVVQEPDVQEPVVQEPEVVVPEVQEAHVQEPEVQEPVDVRPSTEKTLQGTVEPEARQTEQLTTEQPTVEAENGQVPTTSTEVALPETPKSAKPDYGWAFQWKEKNRGKKGNSASPSTTPKLIEEPYPIQEQDSPREAPEAVVQPEPIVGDMSMNNPPAETSPDEAADPEAGDDVWAIPPKPRKDKESKHTSISSTPPNVDEPRPRAIESHPEEDERTPYAMGDTTTVSVPEPEVPRAIVEEQSPSPRETHDEAIVPHESEPTLQAGAPLPGITTTEAYPFVAPKEGPESPAEQSSFVENIPHQTRASEPAELGLESEKPLPSIEVSQEEPITASEGGVTIPAEQHVGWPKYSDLEFEKEPQIEPKKELAPETETKKDLVQEGKDEILPEATFSEPKPEVVPEEIALPKEKDKNDTAVQLQPEAVPERAATPSSQEVNQTTEKTPSIEGAQFSPPESPTVEAADYLPGPIVEAARSLSPEPAHATPEPDITQEPAAEIHSAVPTQSPKDVLPPVKTVEEKIPETAGRAIIPTTESARVAPELSQEDNDLSREAAVTEEPTPIEEANPFEEFAPVKRSKKDKKKKSKAASTDVSSTPITSTEQDTIPLGRPVSGGDRYFMVEPQHAPEEQTTAPAELLEPKAFTPLGDEEHSRDVPEVASQVENDTMEPPSTVSVPEAAVENTPTAEARLNPEVDLESDQEAEPEALYVPKKRKMDKKKAKRAKAAAKLKSSTKGVEEPYPPGAATGSPDTVPEALTGQSFPVEKPAIEESIRAPSPIEEPYEYAPFVPLPEQSLKESQLLQPGANTDKETKGIESVHEGADERTGSPSNDEEFAATVAAALQDAGLSPKIVLDNPEFLTRTSSPGSIHDVNPDEVYIPARPRRNKKRHQYSSGTLSSVSRDEQSESAAEHSQPPSQDPTFEAAMASVLDDPAFHRSASPDSKDAVSDEFFPFQRRPKKKGARAVDSPPVDAPTDVRPDVENLALEAPTLESAPGTYAEPPTAEQHIGESIEEAPAQAEDAVTRPPREDPKQPTPETVRGVIATSPIHSPVATDTDELPLLTRETMGDKRDNVDPNTATMEKALEPLAAPVEIARDIAADNFPTLSSGQVPGHVEENGQPRVGKKEVQKKIEEPVLPSVEQETEEKKTEEHFADPEKPAKASKQAETGPDASQEQVVKPENSPSASEPQSQSKVATLFPGLQRVKRKIPPPAPKPEEGSDKSWSRQPSPVPSFERSAMREEPEKIQSRQPSPVPVFEQPAMQKGPKLERQAPDANVLADIQQPTWGFPAENRNSEVFMADSPTLGMHPLFRDGRLNDLYLPQEQKQEPSRMSTETDFDWEEPEDPSTKDMAMEGAKDKKMSVLRTPPLMDSPTLPEATGAEGMIVSPVESLTMSKQRSSELFQSLPATDSDSGTPPKAADTSGNENFILSAPIAFPREVQEKVKDYESIFGDPIKPPSDATPEFVTPLRHMKSPSLQLGTIREHSPEESPLSKRGRAQSEIGVPEHGVKALRRTTDSGDMQGEEQANEPRSPSMLSERSAASSIGRFKTPERMRPLSAYSNRSATPPLRRVSMDRQMSGDLRAAAKLNEVIARAKSPATTPVAPPPVAGPSTYDRVRDKGKGRAMADSLEGWGDAPGTPLSPTRPPSVRKRQSMQIMDLETRLDQLASENRLLQGAKARAEDAMRNANNDQRQLAEELEARDSQIQAKDAEIAQIKELLHNLRQEIVRLAEVNATLTEANKNLTADTERRYATLQVETKHANEQWQQSLVAMEQLKQQHGQLTAGMEEVVRSEIKSAVKDKDAEILRLKMELADATERVKDLQRHILESKQNESFLTVRDEDYFDSACQQLCQHVQQWVLRFSKFSDTKACRLSSDMKDEKIETRLDNAILDGTDVDMLLADRVKRRDVFMSVVMTMVWEYVFTRYLFGMDREQRQKLKTLEKTLTDVGPPRAVAQWRAITLTLLSQRPTFQTQRAQDTEAVVQEIYGTLSALLPPPSHLAGQIQESLRNVMRLAVNLSIEMRTQRAEYIMLPPLQPEYDINGDLLRKVHFNAALMNERSGETTSNEDLEARQSVVKIVLFPLVVKKGDDDGEGEDEIVVCPAQVLVAKQAPNRKVVRVLSGPMEIDERRSHQSRSSMSGRGGEGGPAGGMGSIGGMMDTGL